MFVLFIILFFVSLFRFVRRIVIHIRTTESAQARIESKLDRLLDKVDR
ncbi:DUF4083 family protein [Paenibacillus terrigena]